MIYFKHCPIPVERGGDCWREPHPASAHGLCEPHWRGIVKQWSDEEPAVSISCEHCGSVQVIDPVELSFAVCFICHKRMEGGEFIREMLSQEERMSLIPADYETTKAGVVYYMRFGDRVKIGYTTDLRTRSKQVPNDEVVAAEPGNILDERNRHNEFKPELIDGQKEWFALSPRLAFHMANIRDMHGEPMRVRKGARLGSKAG